MSSFAAPRRFAVLLWMFETQTQRYHKKTNTRKNIIFTQKWHAKRARLTKDGWSESESKYLRAKILVTEEWAKVNVTKLVEKYASKPSSSSKPSTSRAFKVVKKYREAPDLLVSVFIRRS